MLASTWGDKWYEYGPYNMSEFTADLKAIPIKVAQRYRLIRFITLKP